MLSVAQADHYASQLLKARSSSSYCQPLSRSAGFALADAYLVARQIQKRRQAEGDQLIGRKIAYNNHALLKKYGQSAPDDGLIWTPLFASTVRYLDHAYGVQSLTGAMQPRLAPEIVFHLGRTPEPDASIDDIADCLDWMAHAMEIVVCPYPNWEFGTADAIAAFGMHGALLVGEPHQLSSTARHHLGSILANTTVSLSCDSTLLSAGYGSDIMESPLHALWHLQQLLKNQPGATTLQAGEIISTGTWTDLPHITPGQTWSTAFSGASLAGLSITFG